MPTREEAEAMADAILAAHRTNASADAPTRAPASAVVKYFLVAGFFAGAIVATLPSRNFLVGGIIGLAIGGVVGGLVARRAR